MIPTATILRRLHAQRLAGEPFATPAEAVAWSGAVQAQEHAEALWSLGMRVRGCDAADVQAACDRGEIVRTHVLRPTWHFVAAADLRWLLRLTSPRIQAKGAGRYRELGLDAGTLARCDELLARVGADGEPRTRAQLRAMLEDAGIDVSGQRIAHILAHAELQGAICSGPRRGAHHTYLPLDGRVPPAPQRSREGDVAELVLRYFTSHGPATLRDFAWWSGLTIGDARAGLAAVGDLLTTAPDDTGALWITAADAPAGDAVAGSSGALLLGTYDEALVAYRDLRNVHADGRADNALLHRPIVIDGITTGGWTRRLTRREVAIDAALEGTPSARQRAALARAADRFGAFLGLPARLEIRVG